MNDLAMRPTQGARLRVRCGMRTVLLLAVWSAAAWSQEVEPLPRPVEMVGSLSCTSATCHGAVEPAALSGMPHRQEFLHWLGAAAVFREGRRHYDPRATARSFADPHAHAARRIDSPRYQEIMRRASALEGGRVDPLVAARCARCHDPAGIATAGGEELFSAMLAAGERPLERGIACETCHGGARRWIAAHYQRDASRDELLALGMVDTKDLFVRARMCSTCHVGSAEHDMNHDMIAAGHPPLRFELASYHALIERKHWDDQPRRLAEPNYEVQLWATGRIAAAEASLALLKGRAERAAAKPERHAWPEFAEHNCLACHQPLRPSLEGLFSERSRERAAGVPPWQTWNVLLAEPLLAARSPFEASLRELKRDMERSFTPRPETIAERAEQALAALHERLHVSDRGALVNPHGRPMNAGDALAALERSDASPSWEQACHELAALLAVERALRDAHGGQAAGEDIRRRAARIGQSLRFIEDRQWPAALAHLLPDAAPPRGTMTLDECRRELAALRGELARHWEELPK